MAAQTQNIVVEFPTQQVFQALIHGVNSISGCSITKSDMVNFILKVNMGANMMTWGENIDISLRPVSENQTQLFIASNSKFGFGPFATAQNKKNVENILTAMYSNLR